MSQDIKFYKIFPYWIRTSLLRTCAGRTPACYLGLLKNSQGNFGNMKKSVFGHVKICREFGRKNRTAKGKKSSREERQNELLGWTNFGLMVRLILILPKSWLWEKNSENMKKSIAWKRKKSYYSLRHEKDNNNIVGRHEWRNEPKRNPRRNWRSH